MARWSVVLGLALALGALQPADAKAQNPQTRQGFFISVGLGGGSFKLEDMEDRETGGTGLIYLGGTLSPGLLVGGEISGWTKEVDEGRMTQSNLSAALQFYPVVTSGFFLKGGIGISTLSAEVDVGAGTLTFDETGFGLTAGLGYDIRLGTNFSLTPYGMFAFGSFDGGNANHGQLGLAATFH